MRTRTIILFCLASLLPLQTVAQDDAARQRILRQRLSQIDFYHVAVGIAAEADKNYYVGPQLSAGLGSEHTLLGADVGVRFFLGDPIGNAPRIYQHQLALFASADLNVVRWTGGCFFLGGAIDWRTAVMSRYYDKALSLPVNDGRIAQGHASLQARMGCRLGRRWRAEIGYVYDLAPAFDQKYVFESAVFDYARLRDQLFERGRLGITLSYFIPF